MPDLQASSRRPSIQGTLAWYSDRVPGLKADTARARSEGSGLGLAIAWENARLHGGHIYAGNHPGGGAVFTVSLPLDAPGSL